MAWRRPVKTEVDRGCGEQLKEQNGDRSGCSVRSEHDCTHEHACSTEVVLHTAQLPTPPGRWAPHYNYLHYLAMKCCRWSENRPRHVQEGEKRHSTSRSSDNNNAKRPKWSCIILKRSVLCTLNEVSVEEMFFLSVSSSNTHYQERTHKAVSYFTFILALVARLCWMTVKMPCDSIQTSVTLECKNKITLA